MSAWSKEGRENRERKQKCKDALDKGNKALDEAELLSKEACMEIEGLFPQRTDGLFIKAKNPSVDLAKTLLRMRELETVLQAFEFVQRVNNFLDCYDVANGGKNKLKGKTLPERWDDMTNRIFDALGNRQTLTEPPIFGKWS